MSMNSTIVIPSFNERDNVEPLVTRIQNALAGRDVEIVYVDDSTDGTEDMVREVAATASLPLSVIHRQVARGGLSGAVVDGVTASVTDVVVICDGDCQHPPEVIPAMLDLLEADPELDIVIASRYRPGGDAGGLATGIRRVVSAVATWNAKALFPRRLAQCTDPMTGFFALRRDAVDIARLNPTGFKILLEILATHDLAMTEVPFQFGDWTFGQSKATVAQGRAFLRQLARLRRRRAHPVHGERPAATLRADRERV